MSNQEIKQNSRPRVQQGVGEMKAKFVRVPEKVIEDERDVLDWAVMRRE
jgi:hypothetical protein